MNSYNSIRIVSSPFIRANSLSAVKTGICMVMAVAAISASVVLSFCACFKPIACSNTASVTGWRTQNESASRIVSASLWVILCQPNSSTSVITEKCHGVSVKGRIKGFFSSRYRKRWYRQNTHQSSLRISF